MKKYLKVLTSIGLVLAIAVGFTFAYLTADTGEKVNSFTGANNITGETTETEWEHDENGWKNFLPGDATYKNPTVKINGDQDAWVGLKLTIVDKTTGSDVEMSLADFEAKYGTFYTDVNGEYADPINVAKLAKGMNVGTEDNKWTQFEIPKADDKSKSESVFYVYNTVVKAGTSAKPAKPLFDAVQINTGVYKYYTTSSTKETVYKYQLDENGKKIESTKTLVTENTFISESEVLVDDKGNVINDLKLPTFDIVLHGYAVQASLDKDTAAAELVKLAK